MGCASEDDPGEIAAPFETDRSNVSQDIEGNLRAMKSRLAVVTIKPPDQWADTNRWQPTLISSVRDNDSIRLLTVKWQSGTITEARKIGAAAQEDEQGQPGLRAGPGISRN